MIDFMPKFETTGWYFFGYDLKKTDTEFQQLLAKYKVKADFRNYRGRSAVFVDSPFRVDSIRKRLWGHRWAIHSDWLIENPDLKGFDPRRTKVKL